MALASFCYKHDGLDLGPLKQGKNGLLYDYGA